ncbi:MAG TPA: hypothetical protein PLT68_03535 [Actinomycetota bacterium]|nr:hypothetical protein [Actinomycetota bacterium]
MRTSIGPRWLSGLILIFGLLEIPWVLFLIFTQARTGQAQHTHLAALGLSGGGALMCVVTSVLLWRGSRSVMLAATMAATWLGAGVFFALVLSAVTVVLAGVVGTVVAAVAARRAMRRLRPEPVLAVLMAATAVAMLTHFLLVLGSAPTTIEADHLRVLVVLYDTAEVVSLLGLGWAMRRGLVNKAIAFGGAGVVLFTLDAWVNLAVVPAGPALAAAVFYAVVGEVPSIVMCAAGAGLAMRVGSRQAVTPVPAA